MSNLGWGRLHPSASAWWRVTDLTCAVSLGTKLQIAQTMSGCKQLVHALLQGSSSAAIDSRKCCSGDKPLKQTQSSASLAKNTPWDHVQRRCNKETLNLLIREGPEHLCSAHHLAILQILSLNGLISISHHKSPNHVPRKIMPVVCGEFLMHFTISFTITALSRMKIILLCSFRMINCRIWKDSSQNANNRELNYCSECHCKIMEQFEIQLAWLDLF